MLLLKHIDNNLYLVDTEINRHNRDKASVVTGNEEYQIIAQLKDQLSGVPLFDLPDEKVDVDLSFAIWYSGMDKKKVEAAYQRFLKETKHLSDNKERKYTEADMIKAIDNAFSAANFSTIRTFHQDLAKFKNDYFKAITTPNLQQYNGKQVEIETYTDTVVSGGLFSVNPSGLNMYEVQIPKLTNGKITIIKIV